MRHFASLFAVAALAATVSAQPIGLYPGFYGNPRTGPVGQMVNFTNATYTSDPGGVTSWAWDVDGDLVTDYTTQNCHHTYATEGNKNVTLTVTSALFGTQSLTRNAYIVIGAVHAGFTLSVLPGGVVLFTDTSTGGPTAWAWDFQDDGIVDSTSQNTAFTYPVPGAPSCRLTVTDAFSSDTTTSTILIGTIPLPDWGFSMATSTSTYGFWFRSPTRFSIISARVPNESGHALQNVAIYRLASPPPTYPLMANGGLEFVATEQPNANTLPCVISYDAGECVAVLGACGKTLMYNSMGPTTGWFSFSVLGHGCRMTCFGTLSNLSTSGGTTPYFQDPGYIQARIWLGVTACAAIPYGIGSPSGGGPAAPKLEATALPYVGHVASFRVTQNDSSVLSLMVAGFGRASIPLPPFGTILLNSIDYVAIMNGGAVVGPGNYTYSFAVPNNPGLIGASINWQNANILMPWGQYSLSNANEWWIDL